MADADGFNPQTVAASSEPLMSPAWSPDGRKVAYVWFERKTAAIYVQTLATGQRVKVAEFPGNGAPSWSPDGSRIIFSSKRDGHSNIYIMNADGTNQVRLTNNGFENENPDWSSDGKRIIYTSVDYSDNPSASEEIFVMNADGSEPIQLTHNNVQDLGPAQAQLPGGTKFSRDD